MTPFGIRKKLKSLLGGGAPPAPDAPPRPSWDVKVTAPDGSEYTVKGKEDETLVAVTGRGAYPIMTGCAEGDCGTCRVEVITGMGSLSVETDREQRVKEANKVDPALRLGCQVRINGPGVHLRVFDPFADAEA
ncbi:MAG: (2Fe-2S)-binding protein [Alphaproteobacteria bacterium]|nr:(2Fe-2S)-binding protein [Alphaproteobacteria bacterium]